MELQQLGIVLLGYLLEKVSGESYEKFVQEKIFGPLGMKDSGYDSNSAIIPRRVTRRVRTMRRRTPASST